MTVAQQSPTKSPTPEQITKYNQKILGLLGEPQNQQQSAALNFYHQLESEEVKKLSAYYPNDLYIKTLGYLVATKKPSPAIYTLIAETSRACSDFHREQLLNSLGEFTSTL
jgi:hypothetical protein